MREEMEKGVETGKQVEQQKMVGAMRREGLEVALIAKVIELTVKEVEELLR